MPNLGYYRQGYNDGYPYVNYGAYSKYGYAKYNEDYRESPGYEGYYPGNLEGQGEFYVPRPRRGACDHCLCKKLKRPKLPINIPPPNAPLFEDTGLGYAWRLHYPEIFSGCSQRRTRLAS